MTAAPYPSPGNTSGPLNGWAPSGVYFPSVAGLEMHNVIFTNVWDCYDFGELASPSASQVSIVENTSFSACPGHFSAFHGASSNFSIVRQAVKGGRGPAKTSQPFSAIVFDTSDVGPNTLSNFNLLENDWEGSAWGFLGWLADGTSLQNFNASGNICDSFTFGCYVFFARPNQTGSAQGSMSDFTIADKWGISWYTPLQFDGGGYGGSAGVGSIQFNSGLYVGGGGPTNATSVFYVGGSPAPNGYVDDGSSITIKFPNGVPTPWSWTVTAGPGDTPRTMTEKLAAQVGCQSPPATCFVNPTVGLTRFSGQSS